MLNRDVIANGGLTRIHADGKITVVNEAGDLVWYKSKADGSSRTKYADANKDTSTPDDYIELGKKPSKVAKGGVSKYGQKLDEIGEILEGGLVKGKYSKRTFDPNLAGGKILDMDYKTVTITKEGIETVKRHLSRFGKSSQNEKAIKRLEDILEGKTSVTDYDKKFYTHELREYDRYQEIGIPDGVHDSKVWENAHSATLEDYRIHETQNSVYHPDTEPTIDDLLNEY